MQETLLWSYLEWSVSQDTSAREESLELYSILWPDWPTSKQKVLRHGKSLCRSGSQTLFFGGREATTGNASAVRMLIDPRTIKIQVFNYATVETFRNHLNLSDLSGNSPQNYECCLMVCLQKNLRIFCFHNTLWMDNRRSVPVLTLKRVRTESVF